MSAATVYLVGAGPGDPGLLTVRGRELLRRADVVLYDYLVSDSVLNSISASAELFSVGKKGFSDHVSQDQINELLIEQARRVGARGGTTVVRLKGGDPFLFGRGGEEALALARSGVPYQVVPGVTSGIAASAYAGIPVTHRGIASTVCFVAGNENPAKSESNIDWAALTSLVLAGGTACLYMGMHNLGLVSERFRTEGLPADIPTAIVQWGTTPKQKTLVSTLSDVEAAARDEGIGAPAIILVGRVAELRNQIAWFEGRPLFGRSYVVTRTRPQASELASRLCDLGADTIECPTIAICDPDDFGPLDAALSKIGTYDWVVFTSANGVDAFFSRLPGDARSLASVRVATIGPATAERLAHFGICADTVPAEYRAEALFEAMEQAGSLQGARVLVARAQEARKELPRLLRAAGARVDVVAAYKTIAPSQGCETDFGQPVRQLVLQLQAGKIDGVTFSSSSTARNLVAVLGADAQALEKTTLYSIGPITSATLRSLGFDNIVEAREYTIDGLLTAIIGDNE